MGLLTRDQILAAGDLETETVHVPEWGGEVQVSELSAARRVMLQGLGDQAFAVALVAAACTDADGQPLFSESDVEALQGKSPAALWRVAEVAIRLNKIGAQATEEEQGNS